MPPGSGSVATVLTIRDGRHPIAVLTMMASAVAGAIGLLLPPSPVSAVDRFIPEPWRHIYYGLLLTAGLIVTVAVWLPDLRDRLIWERIGLLPFTGVLLVYPIALVYVATGTVFGLGTIISSMFGIAGMWRIVDITCELNRWKRTVARIKRAESSQ